MPNRSLPELICIARLQFQDELHIWISVIRAEYFAHPPRLPPDLPPLPCDALNVRS